MQYDCATPLPYTFVLLPAVLRIKAGSLPGVNSLTLPPSTLPLSLNLFLFLQTTASLPMPALPGPPSWLFPLPGIPFSPLCVPPAPAQTSLSAHKPKVTSGMSVLQKPV